MAFDPTLRFPTGWTLLKSTAPTSGYPDDIAYTSSVTNAVWSDRSIAVYKFAPFVLDVFQTLIFGRIGVAGTLLTTHSDLPKGLTASATSGIGMRVRYASELRINASFVQELRLIPIYSDFDHTALTWNTRGTLDEGLTPIKLSETRHFYSVPTFIGGTSALAGMTNDEAFSPLQLDGLTYVPHSSVTTTLLGLKEPGIKVPLQFGKDKCYGAILETRTRVSRLPPANPPLVIQECWFGLQPTAA